MICNHPFRVNFSGGAASGKSTAARAVSDCFGIPMLPSFSRKAMELVGVDFEIIQNDKKKAKEFQQVGIALQYLTEMRLIEKGISYVSDRHLADFFAYSRQQLLYDDYLEVHENSRDLLLELVKHDSNLIVFCFNPNRAAFDEAVKNRNNGNLKGWLDFNSVIKTYLYCFGILRAQSLSNFIEVKPDTRVDVASFIIEKIKNFFSGCKNTIQKINDYPKPALPDWHEKSVNKIATDVVEEMEAYSKTMKELFLKANTKAPIDPLTASEIENLSNDRVRPDSLECIQNLPGLLNDVEIERIFGFGGRMKNYDPGTKREFYISSGLSSGGYDFVLGREFRIFSNANSHVIDPLKIDESCFVKVDPKTDENGREYVMLPPYSYILAESNEFIDIPDNILILCVGKSTYARMGLIANLTPLEPGWRGVVTLEVSNPTPLAVKIYIGMGIVQALFFRMVGPARKPYGSRSGRYQDQKGLTLPKAN